MLAVLSTTTMMPINGPPKSSFFTVNDPSKSSFQLQMTLFLPPPFPLVKMCSEHCIKFVQIKSFYRHF